MPPATPIIIVSVHAHVPVSQSKKDPDEVEDYVNEKPEEEEEEEEAAEGEGEEAPVEVDEAVDEKSLVLQQLLESSVFHSPASTTAASRSEPSARPCCVILRGYSLIQPQPPTLRTRLPLRVSLPPRRSRSRLLPNSTSTSESTLWVHFSCFLVHFYCFLTQKAVSPARSVRRRLKKAGERTEEAADSGEKQSRCEKTITINVVRLCLSASCFILMETGARTRNTSLDILHQGSQPEEGNSLSL